MEFLRPVKETRKTTTNLKRRLENEPESSDTTVLEATSFIANTPVGEENVSSQPASTPTPKKSRNELSKVATEDKLEAAFLSYVDKLGTHLDSNKNTDSETNSWCDLVKASVVKLRPRNQLELKKRVLDLLHEYQMSELDD
ncbi:uncharacterized protein LOC129594604 [Paramacrobiotus metropolitanus]|uniref:uncharacterized protein LOC129594604 n=1 Tax=Paramacrobiotus metropolitanus TaxID=2943436 RepID=UPI002445B17C|nr:uncharacterized protein LOC129594604 [Paramacrobiotus metropolitanus]